MGRLTKIITRKSISLSIPFFLSFVLFLLVRPVLAQLVEEVVITPSKIEVGSMTQDGYSQVYYVKNGERKFLTSGNRNSRMPHNRGAYITWVTDVAGGGQIFLHNYLTDITTQLTFIGTNLEPRVSEKGEVVWEGWSDNSWQVFFFTGNEVRKLTSDGLSMNPDIENGYIVYAVKDIEKGWSSVGYSINEDKSVVIRAGEDAKHPILSDNKIIYVAANDAFSEEPLTLSDIFLLSNE